MTRLQQLEQEAQALTESERAQLAARLLATLPVVLSDENEGLSEALRRDAEMDASEDAGISWEDLKKDLGR